MNCSRLTFSAVLGDLEEQPTAETTASDNHDDDQLLRGFIHSGALKIIQESM